MNKPLFGNKTYDVLKYIAQIVLPGLGTFYFTIASLWHLPKADEVVGTIVCLDAFLGGLLQISSVKYDKTDASNLVGVMNVENQNGKILYSLEVTSDMSKLAEHDEIRFKVNGQ